MTAESTRTLADEIASLWAGRDLDNFTSAAAKYLTTGSATDWGMATSIQSSAPPITLGGGIPDPTTLPRQRRGHGRTGRQPAALRRPRGL